MTHADKPLFTPGPLTTSRTVKEAMLRDLGSRDQEFIDIVRDVRRGILEVGGLGEESGYDSVILQGSGTYGIEAAFTCFTPPDGHWLILVNGAYGERIVKIAELHGIAHTVHRTVENEYPDVDKLQEFLRSEAGHTITGIATVHCETTTGILNPIESIGQQAREHGALYLVDSMSAFGAVPIDFEASAIDVLISSSNKCIEGVPGFAFVIARRELLEQTQGRARALTLDLHAQWQGLEKNGQFRFTPPTHVILAFHQALRELREEGGVRGRGTRYAENHRVLSEGMRALGFQEYVEPSKQGYIITSYLYPSDDFDFDDFYSQLNDRGYVIYPGKLTHANCFRVGNIGRLGVEEIRGLLAAVGEVCSGSGRC